MKLSTGIAMLREAAEMRAEARILRRSGITVPGLLRRIRRLEDQANQLECRALSRGAAR